MAATTPGSAHVHPSGISAWADYFASAVLWVRLPAAGAVIPFAGLALEIAQEELISSGTGRSFLG